MLFLLILKCMERLLANIKNPNEIKQFEILLELYKFFKNHPPENLIVINFNYYFLYLKLILIKNKIIKGWSTLHLRFRNYF